MSDSSTKASGTGKLRFAHDLEALKTEQGWEYFEKQRGPSGERVKVAQSDIVHKGRFTDWVSGPRRGSDAFAASGHEAVSGKTFHSGDVHWFGREGVSGLVPHVQIGEEFHAISESQIGRQSWASYVGKKGGTAIDRSLTGAGQALGAVAEHGPAAGRFCMRAGGRVALCTALAAGVGLGGVAIAGRSI